jgi:hypothetical protein
MSSEVDEQGGVMPRSDNTIATVAADMGKNS